MHFFGLHIKSLINLKIASATFGIGGGQLPPLATRLCLLISLAIWNNESIECNVISTLEIKMDSFYLLGQYQSLHFFWHY